jgi:hypothetical protein
VGTREIRDRKRGEDGERLESRCRGGWKRGEWRGEGGRGEGCE